MRPIAFRRLVGVVLSATLAMALGLTIAPAAPAAAASAGGDATFAGHGWGHGRGMGQFGALGYAINYGWNYAQILDHFYGGTTLQGVGNPLMTVELMARTGTELVAIGRGLTVNGGQLPEQSTTGTAVRVTPSGTSFLIETAASCAGPWSAIGTAPTVKLSTSSQASADNYIRVCEAAGERFYRGALTVQRHASTGVETTFNELSTEDYLRGVVPHESPDGWGSLPNGMEALKAQAVAARSYALSGTRSSGARTCDTTTCQVYLGAAFQPWGPNPESLDGKNADAAIAATAGQVRMFGSVIARTEFSSSTGGWTAGGVFPAVVDLGDSVGYNTRSSWATTLPLSTVATKLGTGQISSIVVIERNGLGADGGRALKVLVTMTGGAQRTFTGDAIRLQLGLNSDWFSISSVSLAESQSVVRALYQDLLGRGPDPTGLAGWSAALVSGTSQSELVGALTRSDEYIALRVTKAYNEVLGRGPDPQGAADWLAQIRAGYGTVDDVQLRFYGSQEFFLITGGTTAGYIQRLYTTMLRRGASDADVAAWAGVLASSGPAAMVNAIWFSTEAASVRAGDYYATFLGRGPDPTGLAGWTQVLLAYGQGAVRIGIAGSLEYRAKAIVRYP
ncbi:MAG: DUF4214 domain-containing protein [Cellulomonas sp.]